MNAADKALSDTKNLSEQAHDRIRRDILNGGLFPGEKLQIEAISERYGIGIAPVREALNRLSSEGLVERKSQRGFFVAEISMTALEELVKTRIWLETLGLFNQPQRYRGNVSYICRDSGAYRHGFFCYAAYSARASRWYFVW